MAMRKISELEGMSIAATDGQLGNVQDLYFDDDRWIVRYLVVDTGRWLPGRLVLLSPEAVEHVDDSGRTLAVHLTQHQVENSPGVESNEPVSRQREIEIRKYYGWPTYWPPVGADSARAMAAMTADRETDPHLRSADEVIGYSIHARDGDIGHVDDLLLDETTWEIRFVVIDTGNWFSGKKVLAPIAWIERVDWPQSSIHVQATQAEIRGAPEFDPAAH
jgi:sporulation protein YlmC with PRC-barrel domain